MWCIGVFWCVEDDASRANWVTHPDMHFCKQSFPLVAPLIYLGTTTFWLKGRGPRRDSTQPCVLVSSCLSVLCPLQVWGFGLGLLSQITSREYTAGPHTHHKNNRRNKTKSAHLQGILICITVQWGNGGSRKILLSYKHLSAVIRGFRLSTLGGCQLD